MFLDGLSNGKRGTYHTAGQEKVTAQSLSHGPKNELARFPGETEPDRLFEGDEEFIWKLEGRGTGALPDVWITDPPNNGSVGSKKNFEEDHFFMRNGRRPVCTHSATSSGNVSR